MPRPERLEYKNALYHVMNRGRGRQNIFHGEKYYHAFESTLAEVHKRFGARLLAYCLMGNHYHLLLQTPRGNLSRVMRHINGVYTQRYNYLKNTDGPLFRGRFKSLLVEDDIYALYVSRYIHRNPVDMKKPLVKNLENYHYSSYPAYVNKSIAPEWLDRDFLYSLEGSHQRYRGMQRYVEQGVDEETEKLYQKGRWPMVYGGEHFRAWVYEVKLPEKNAPKKAAIVTNTASLTCVIDTVCQFYKKSPEELFIMKRGKGYQNKARNIAIYLCQEIAEMKLSEILPRFGFSHINSVSCVTSKMRRRVSEDKSLKREIEEISCLIVKT